MAVETATYISDLNAANPPGPESLRYTDDHLRLIKQVLQNTFPNFSAALTSTPQTLDGLPGRVDQVETDIANLQAEEKAIVRSDASDTSPGYLDAKLATGDGLSRTVANGQVTFSAVTRSGLSVNTSGIGLSWSSLAAQTGLAADDILAIRDTSASEHRRATLQELADYFYSLKKPTVLLSPQLDWSTNQTVWDHGLGGEPDLVTAWLECTTAEGGFAVGDKIKAAYLADYDEGSSTHTHVWSVWANQTQVGLSRYGTLAASVKGGGSYFYPSTANWALVFKVVLF